jgi:hypothetical protein
MILPSRISLSINPTRFSQSGTRPRNQRDHSCMRVPESYPHRDSIRCKTCRRSPRSSCRPGGRSASRRICESNPHPISVRRRHSPASASENPPGRGNVHGPHVTEEASHRRRRPHGRTRRIHIYPNKQRSRRAGARHQTQHRRSVRGTCRLCRAPSDIRYTKISSGVETFGLHLVGR